MCKIAGNHEHAEVKKRGWLSKRFLPILTLLLITAIAACVFYFYINYPGKIDGLKAYGYLGAFLISLILNATVVLPAGNFLVITALSTALPSATLVGVVGGTGAVLGEITGYMAGYSGRAIIQKREMYTRLDGWVRKRGI